MQDNKLCYYMLTVSKLPIEAKANISEV
jgi:hypothetical protein